MGGLLGIGQAQQDSAMQGLGRSAILETNRENSNQQLKSQARQQTASMAASGAMIGTMIMPGWGTAIGAGIGFIAGELM